MLIPMKKQKTQKRYRLYCPQSVTDTSGKGYNTFETRYIKCEENTIEHLMRIGEIMTWYQIVDIRDNMKVVKDSVPDIL